MNTMKLSVIIPAQNEEKNIEQTISELSEKLNAEKIPFEIIAVDDNSTDRTADVIKSIMAKDPAVRLVQRQLPSGFGRAIRDGIENVSGEVVVICMADLSDDPKDVVAYYRKIGEGFDCVYGSRFIKGASVKHYPLLKLIVNRIVNKMIQWLFWCPFNDLTNAFKAYRTDVVRTCGPYRAIHFNITIEMSLSALVRGYSVAQIPISWQGRTWGSSKLKLREMGRRYLAILLKVFAERLLISDDLVAERLAKHEHDRETSHKVEDRLAETEAPVALLETRLRNEQANNKQ